MNANLYLTLRCAGLVAGVTLALPSARAAAPTDAFPNFESYIKISGRAADITGSETSFARRLQQSKEGAVGIEELHYTKDLKNDKTLTVDGRALAGSEDYLLKLNLTKTEFGSVETGYKRFRTFYDGTGGFFPLNGTWMPLNNQNLHVDRGELWAQANWNKPGTPEVSLRYSNSTRTGRKDTTVWGDTDFTGLPNNNPPISPVRKLVPAYRDLNERHEELVGTLKHSVGKTNYELSLIGDATNDHDTRFSTRFPGEVKLFPTPASTVLVPAANMNNQVQFLQTDGMKTKTFAALARTSTEFNEKLTLETGFNYQLLHSDFTGDRPLATSTPTAVGTVILPSNNYSNLIGGSKVKVYTGTMAVILKPRKDFTAKLALKGEDEYIKGSGTFTSITSSVSTTTGAVTITQTPNAEFSRTKEQSLTPALDLGYTGFKNVSLYATGNKRFVNGDENYAAPYSTLTNTVAPDANRAINDTSRENARYAVGATWRLNPELTLRGELFYKDNTTKFVGYGIDLGDYYALSYQFTGVKLTVTHKLTAQFSATTRYIYQEGKATVTGYLPSTPEYDSMDAKNHMIAETLNWSPNAQCYVQATGGWVFNTISTIYPHAGTVPATSTNISWDANKVLQNADNNYFTGSLVAGAVLTKHDDLLVQVTYYRADNYNPAVAAITMPYGAGVKEISVSAGVKHKFTDRMLGNAKIGYFESKNDTTGGHTNFHGPLAYVSLEYSL